MKLFLILIICLTFALVSFGQNVEYGKPEELKGLTKIFIDTNFDLNSRNQIAKEIEKAKLSLEIVDSHEKAQCVLLFVGRTVESGATANSTDVFGSTQTTIQTIRRRAGSGIVFIEGKKWRILLSGEYIQRTAWNKPAEKFAKDFIKAYKEANKPSKK